jgi:alpha-L-rhamnosidase
MSLPRVVGVLAFSCVLATASPAESPVGTGPFTRAQWLMPSDPSVPVDRRPCPVLRKSFRVDGNVSAATVSVVGLGHFELYCNGRRVGSSVINQPWSQYNKTIYWQEFDLKPLLRTGENVLGVQLGNSFWRVGEANDSMRYTKTDAMPDFSDGRPYLLLLQAGIRTSDGKERIVATDSSWKWHDGPLTFSNIYAGEDYDARVLSAHWAEADFDDHDWRTTRLSSPPWGTLKKFNAPPIREFEVFKPETIVRPGTDEYTYVFPQNSSALLRFTVRGKAGERIRFRPCEYMDSTGRVKFTYTWGTHKDIWHDYTLRGSEDETHQVLFCYEGCQYVGVTGAVPEGFPNPNALPVISSLDLVHVRAACPPAGTFTCSSEMQNKAYHMIDWSVRSNMSYVATDCPHREKNGWQEENWHMARAVSYAFDVHAWYTKILGDIRDAQLPDGHIPTNCPNYLVGIPPHGYWNEAPEWGISGVLVPWHLYEWYGDKNALAVSFSSMKRYVDYLGSLANDGIITSNLGDWYDYGHGKGDGPSQWTPNDVSATAVWALGARTVSATANVLGRTAEAQSYQKMYEQIRSDFQRHFYDPVKKMVRNNGSCQAAHSVAIQAGLIPEGDCAAVLEKIIDDLEARGYQQTVGEVLQVMLIRTLAEGNRNDVLHRIYAREERGGYGYMVKQGFTTLPESWDARPGTGNSMNHFMLGHLMEWHYAYVAGIRQQEGGVGWRKVVIGPNPGSLDSAAASFDSPAGRIVSSWKRSGKHFTLTATIPAGVHAIARMPDGKTKTLRVGSQILNGNIP